MNQPRLSIVIPTLDAAANLPQTLDALAPGRGLIQEILVVDGGSRDDTLRVAEAAGATVLTAARGRGSQLAAGGAAAGGGWLLFLHADTVLAPDWAVSVQDFMAEGEGNERRAAVFRLALDDDDPRARRIERLANWRTRMLGLPYGDQGLLVAARFYRELGGFRPLSLMEDVDLARRIGRGRLVVLPAVALTSAARYRRGGWWLRPLRNLSILGLYFLGVPPDRLHRLYG